LNKPAIPTAWRSAIVRTVVVLFCCFPIVANVFTKDLASKGKFRRQVLGAGPHYTLLNINNMEMWVSDDGTMERNPLTQTAGVIYPRGTSTVVYASGLIWGGLLHDGNTLQTVVGGQDLTVGTTRGAIVAPGITEDTSNDGVRVYRIRRDWKTADLRQDVADLLGESIYDVTDNDVSTLRAQYARDWMEWPWQKGAPFIENNGIAGYQPDTSGSAGADQPGVGSADEVIWYVCNDLDGNRVSQFAGSIPLGMELQVTCWAYKSPAELSNVIFERYRLIYKGTASTGAGAYVDSMYLGKWSNPNIGDNSDDYAGYDSIRSLGYAYNSQDADLQYSDFNIVPPAFGYDFLQGPRIYSPGSTAQWNLGVIPNYRNIPVQSALIFTNAYYEVDSTGIPGFSPVAQWTNILHGFRPRPVRNPACFTDPFLNECQRFVLTGDPVTNTGWNDGRQSVPGDRRLIESAGPFRLTLGDTQEVVIALVGGTGKDHLDAITSMRTNDDAAQNFYGFSFSQPDSLIPPDVTVSDFANSAILEWETDTATIRKTESYRSGGYQFYGYNIYQYSDSSTSSSVMQFPPFDLNGPRSIQVTKDLFRDKPLVNGQSYYYTITSLIYNPAPLVSNHYIESQKVLRTVVPHSPDPGTVYPYAVGDTMTNIINLVGVNEAPISVVYYNPAQENGDTFKLVFHRVSLSAKPTWDLIDLAKLDTLIRGLDVNTGPQRVLGDGFTISVESPHEGVSGVYLTKYGGTQTQQSIFNVPNSAGDMMVVGAGTSILDTLSGGKLDDQDIEWRFTGDSSWTLFVDPRGVPYSKWRRVPFTLWELNRYTQVPREVYGTVSDGQADSIWRPSNLLNRIYNGKTLLEYYPISVFADSVSQATGYYPRGGYDDNIPFKTASDTVKRILWASTRIDRVDSRMTIWRAYLVDVNQDGIPAPRGTVIRLKKFKDIFPGDIKLIVPKAYSTNNYAAAQTAVQQINVFPNPYYGYNPAEKSRTDKFVTFSHLPENATIRIFNLAGVLVKTIVKSGGGQFVRWDLNNENALPAASGIYLVHMELKDASGISLGSKILKLMVVQEQRYFQSN